MNLKGEVVVDLLFTLAATIIACYLLAAIFLFYTDILTLEYLPGHLLLLGLSVVFFYASRYHPINHRIGRILATFVTGIPLLGITTYLGWSLREEVVLDDIRSVFQEEILDPTLQSFLPQWWLMPIIGFAGVLILIGALTRWGYEQYATPRQIIKLSNSPVYFGLFTTLLGLWAVLFVGIGLQRVIIIAPIFEEFLKFGIALTIGSALFGRSFCARVGIALVIGMLFGLVEHAVTYATEPDIVYVFRTVFHSITTMLSVGLYTRFEQTGYESLLWYAPIISITFHFLHNLFVVISGLILLIVLDQEVMALPIAYSSISIILMTFFLVLSLIRLSWVIAIHEPYKHVLSNLV